VAVAIRVEKTPQGERRTLDPDSGITVQVYIDFTVLENNGILEEREERKRMTTGWLNTNSHRLKFIPGTSYYKYLKMGGDLNYWTLSFLEREGHIKNLMEEGFGTEYRQENINVINWLKRYDIEPGKAPDLNWEGLDLILEDLVEAKRHLYLQRTDCNSPEEFFNGAWTYFNEHKPVPASHKKFWGVNVGEFKTLYFGSIKNYNDYFDAGYNHKEERQTLLKNSINANKISRILKGGLFPVIPSDNKLHQIGATKFPKFATCIHKKLIFGMPPEHPDKCEINTTVRQSSDFASAPKFSLSATFEHDAVFNRLSINPYTLKGQKAFLHEGCKSNPTPIGHGLNPYEVKTWGEYKATVKLTGYDLSVYNYDNQGVLKSISRQVLNQAQPSSVSLKDLERMIKSPETFDEQYSIQNNALETTVSIRFHESIGAPRPHYFWDGSKGGMEYTKGIYLEYEYFNSGLIAYAADELRIGGNDAEFWYELDNRKYEIEFSVKNNLPHGPVKFYDYYEDKRGKLLVEGHFDNGILLGGPDSRACRKGRCS